MDIDQDVLDAAKALARAESKTVGLVISELARKALTTPSALLTGASPGQPGFAEGQAPFDGPVWHTLPGREGVVVTPELVERVQDLVDREDATPWDHEADEPRKL